MKVTVKIGKSIVTLECIKEVTIDYDKLSYTIKAPTVINTHDLVLQSNNKPYEIAPLNKTSVILY